MLGWLGLGLIFVGLIIGGTWGLLFDVTGIAMTTYALFKWWGKGQVRAAKTILPYAAMMV